MSTSPIDGSKPANTSPVTKKIAKSRKYGPRITLQSGDGGSISIPVGTHAGSVAMAHSTIPAAWKIETIPDIAKIPNRANYYKNSFTNGQLRRHAWQYMFGGIFRAIFGIYAPTKYWRPELEKDVEEGLRQYYGKSKKSGDYGLYSFVVKKALYFTGIPWRNGQPPLKRSRVRKSHFILKRDSIIEVRINKLDYETPRIDIELKPRGARDRETRTYTVEWRLYSHWLKVGKFAPLKEGKIYDLRNFRKKSDNKPRTFPLLKVPQL